MKRLIRNVMVLAFAAVVGTTAAHAQATRTWVSGVGDDVNPCSRTAPCKTWAGAISKTAARGEINALDPGGFGAVTITKSITIDGGETFASILSPGTNGIIINPANTDHVTIRNIEINGAGTGLKGIRVLNGAAVNIENVQIYDIGAATGRCIEVVPNSTMKVNIVNTTLQRCNDHALFVNPAAGFTVTLTADNLKVYNSLFSAVDIVDDTKATITRSFLTHNGGAGVFADLATAEITVTDSVLSNNQFGVFSGNGGAPVIRIGGCTITRNTTSGLNLNGGTVVSWGDNYIAGNAGNENPSSTILRK